ncbi:MAG TPA: flagellar biosynthesis protein FlhB [Stellaceae bacterium]|jgi:flagellar biosynthetic protein FlhB|nr:flagellar biosynthesis protein FlhB [Stellaceae bacterium]
MAAEDQDSRTEEATGKRLAEGRERGQVASSKDLTTLAMLSASTAVILTIMPWSMRPVLGLMRSYIERPDQYHVDTMTGLSAVLVELAKALGYCFAPVFGIMVGTAFAVHIFQTGWIWATKKVGFNEQGLQNLINPLQGFKRLFSFSAMIEFAKGLIKVIIISALGYVILKPAIMHIEPMVGMEPVLIMGVLRQQLAALLFPILGVIGAIGLLDFFYQKWQVAKSLRMTKEEVKEEYKNQEGDPHIKGHMRKIRLTRARKRMLAAVPKAAVVITNPTHYAIALHYEMGSNGAPTVVAKGVDFLAARIREIATENDVPIVENPPLARSLYATVDLDEEIPPEHYKAVAEIIGFVMRLNRRAPAARAS